MKRKITVLALCAMLFALCQSAEAQQPKKVSRIGYLSNADAATDYATDSARAEGIRLGVCPRNRFFLIGCDEIRSVAPWRNDIVCTNPINCF